MNFKIIDAYYRARGLGYPSAKEALLFFLSEVGELAEAYLATKANTLTDEEQSLFSDFEDLGMRADEIVSRVPGWVRNNDRTRKQNVPYEAADCEMMLSVFLHCYNGQIPEEALLQKMESKVGKPYAEWDAGA